MDAQDEKSEICRMGSELVDVAEIYGLAADRVSDPALKGHLWSRQSRRAKMGDELLMRAGLGGRPTGSLLPTADEVWLKLKNFISSDDAAVVAPAHSVDQMLLDSVEQFLQSTPTAPAAAAARWLM